MQKEILRLALVGLLISSFGAQAETIYQVYRSVGTGVITGTVETNGTIGPLETSDILNWSFEADDGTDIITISSESGGALQGNAWSHLSATATELRFDFDGTSEDPDAEFIAFHGEDSPQTYSFDYNLVGSAIGQLEQLVHQFGTDGQHWIQSSRQGVRVIGSVECPLERCPPGSSLLKLMPLILSTQDED